MVTTRSSKREPPPFSVWVETEGGRIPVFVEQEFADYLKCRRLKMDFCRLRAYSVSSGKGDYMLPTRLRHGPLGRPHPHQAL